MLNYITSNSFSEYYDEHFEKTLATLPMLGRINELHAKRMQEMKMTSSNENFPPLHREVFDSGRTCS